MSLPTVCVALALCLAACQPQSDSVPPDTGGESAEPAKKEKPPAEASPEMVANMQTQVGDAYGRDFEWCLEEQMEAEDTQYMRASFIIALTVESDGTVSNANVNTMDIRTRNYEGEDLGEGNADNMGACLVKAAKEWEFDPTPPSTTTFDVAGQVGD